mgnify:CR=1 FL=1
MRKMFLRTISSLFLLGILIAYLFPFFKTSFLSLAVLNDLVRPGKGNLLERFTDEPRVERVRFPGGGREMEADLYRPGHGKRHAGVILVHGVNEEGKNDPRMVWAARIFARAGFATLVPDFSGFKSQRLRISDVDEIVDSFLYLSRQGSMVFPEKIGLVGFSYGAGPTLIAAADPRINGSVRFTVSFGGYYDMENLIKFITTGYYDFKGNRYYLEPNDYDRWIFLRYNLELLEKERDRRLLLQIIEAKTHEGEKVRSLVRDLSPDGIAVYQLLINRDPDQVPILLQALSPRLRGYISTLSPRRVVKDLKAYLFIVHGEPDNFIPHTESLRLYEALPDKGRARMGLLRIFSHVRPTLPKATIGSILKVYIPEGVKFYSLIHDFLRQQR